ncbi:M23 family metallopeptidase [Alkalihalobacillus pseudalcaliphilus]|uniref:M23 family metallopeptidase n=1 Tax=Alkalihalobacillus pseudalcaliphilus TaxID=79884 RepID=UPI00069EC143|nr:M23 family metallopeptidase [Alkalihalobacillus pseudalcaliphilus]
MWVRKKHNKNRHELRAGRQISKRWIATFVFIFFISGFSNVLASSGIVMERVYHLYIDEEFIGTINEEDELDDFLQVLIEEKEEKYEGLTFNVVEEIDIVSEIVFIKNAESEMAFENLAEAVTLKAVATALVINEEEIVYLPAEEAFSKLKQAIVMDQVEEEAFLRYQQKKEAEKRLVDSDSSEREVVQTSAQTNAQLDLNEKRIESINFLTDIEKKEVLVNPDKVVSVERAFSEVEAGKETEVVYDVQEGDSLSQIAKELDVSMKELVDFNNLESDSVIRPGDELKIRDMQTYLDLEVIEVSKKEEEIDYDVEIKEDTSLYKDEKKVERAGKKGLQYVEYETTYVNGEKVEQEVIDQEVIEEPVSKVVIQGTKERSELAWPADGGYISSHQGNRWGRYHKGIDIARPSTFEIYAAERGTITAVTSGGGYGNYIRIRHDNGMETLYAHLKSTSVNVGQTVKRGEQIGVMGSTGDSTGIHLHFEVTRNGQLLNPIDYLP